MRAQVRRVSLIAVLAIALPCLGDATIYLKNGKTIVADSATEKNGRVQYSIGENEYAIPASVVDHIDRPSQPTSGEGQPVPLSGGAVRPSRDSGAMAEDPVQLPAVPTGGLAAADRLSSRIIRDGKVDDEALALLERAGNADATAAGFFAAGRFQFERGNRERARFYFERALGFAPRNETILSHYAATLVQLGRAAEAVPFAERAARLAPNSADAFTVLGFAYYGSNGDGRAISAWKHALDLRPDDTLKAYLEKAQREEKAESDFRQAETGHFVIHFEGASTGDAIRAGIQSELERAYVDLSSAFGVSPRASIPVSLYTNQAFFDVTQAPAWSGAINDGRLRIPVQGLTEVTPELRRVLRHELTHSFINQAAGGRCPQWLNEGIAQLLEPRTIGATRGPRLAQLYSMGQQIPLNNLEVSFLSFSPFEAVLAYDESLAASEYIRDTYGMSDLETILSKIGEGNSTESALRTTIHESYASLEESLGRFLKTKYSR